MAHPRVTIGIPFYNAAAYLRRSIDSVLAQTFTDFELLLSDDGSTDESLAIAQSYIDPRIRILQPSGDHGAPQNFNRCLQEATGEYICIFHADDLMHPKNVEEKVRMLDAHPDVGMIFSNARYIDADGKEMDRDWGKRFVENFVMSGPDFAVEYLSLRTAICAPTVVMRTSVVRSVGGFDCDLNHCCDRDMWAKMCCASSIGYCADPLVSYRWHDTNDSHRFEGSPELIRQQTVVSCLLIKRLDADRQSVCRRNLVDYLRLERMRARRQGNWRLYRWYVLVDILRFLPLHILKSLRLPTNTC